MIKSDEILRQIEIAAFVLENPNRFSEDDLAEKFNVSIGTLRRDLKALRNENVDVRSRKRLINIYSIPSISLNNFISTCISFSQKNRVKNIRLFEKKFKKKILSVFVQICKAIRQRRVIEFTYGNDNPKIYSVIPLYLNPTQTSFHLITLHNEDIKFFNLEYIDKLSLSRQRVKFKTAPDIFSLYRNTWGYYTGGEEVEVKLKFNKDSGSYVAEKLWMENQKIDYVTDGVILTLKVRLSFEFIAWVMGWGGEVVVLKPTGLKKIIFKKATELVNLNRDDS